MFINFAQSALISFSLLKQPTLNDTSLNSNFHTYVIKKNTLNNNSNQSRQEHDELEEDLIIVYKKQKNRRRKTCQKAFTL